MPLADAPDRPAGPPDAGPPDAGPPAEVSTPGERQGLLATARTIAVTAAVVAGTLLAGGYVVRTVTSSERPLAPATNVSTSNEVGVAPGSELGRPLPPMRGGRRPGGREDLAPPDRLPPQGTGRA